MSKIGSNYKEKESVGGQRRKGQIEEQQIYTRDSPFGQLETRVCSVILCALAARVKRRDLRYDTSLQVSVNDTVAKT